MSILFWGAIAWILYKLGIVAWYRIKQFLSEALTDPGFYKGVGVFALVATGACWLFGSPLGWFA